MDTNRRQKRRRITKHDRHVQPDAVASSFRESYPPVVAVVSDLPVRSQEYPPSSKNISAELRKIEGSSSKTKSILALKQIQQWLTDKQAESSASVLENFHCYGGIARLLDFLEENMDDWDCVVGTAALFSDFLLFRWNEIEKSRKTAIELAKIIVRRKGVQLFLRANRDHAIMHKLSSETKHIWIVLGRTINGEDTRGMIEKEQTICILNDAVNCIRRLEELRNCIDCSNPWTTDVLQAVLYTIANTIKNAPIETGELKRTGIVESCLRIIDADDIWTRNDTVVTYALGILVICAKRRMNVSRKDLEILLPQLIYCLKKFSGNLQVVSFVLILVESMCEKIHKEKIESSGMLEAISALLKSKSMCGKTKDKARNIMRKIIS